MSVVVIGASGAVGGAVVEGLLAQGTEVRATSRNPQMLALSASVPTFAADFADPASFAEALSDAERVFMYADLEEPEAFARMLASSGVQHVVLLSSSAVTFSGAEDDFNGARFIRVENAIADAGITHTFLRPGEFANNAARWRWSIAAADTVPLPHPEAVQAPVHERDIADVAVAALTGDDLIGQAPVLTGPERLTLRQQVATIASVVGRNLTVTEQTEAESAATLAQHLPDVWVRQIITGWRDSVGTEPPLADTYRQITGRNPRTFRTWVDENRGLFG